MKIKRTLPSGAGFAAVVGMAGLVGTSAGCASLEKNQTYRSIIGQTVLGLPQSGPQSGPELVYLTDEPSNNPKDSLSAQNPLLPLQTGNYWQMQTQHGNVLGKETVVVTGPAKNAYGQTGFGVETQRNNKRFRYEIYQQTPKGLYLLAAQDETSALMSYNPPLPIAAYPSAEGKTLLWRGTVKVGAQTAPATAISRFSTQESTKTRAGAFHVFRMDTMISMTPNGQDIRFPAVRWMAPGIGFVRRGYAEKSGSAFAEVTKFNVR